MSEFVKNVFNVVTHISLQGNQFHKQTAITAVLTPTSNLQCNTVSDHQNKQHYCYTDRDCSIFNCTILHYYIVHGKLFL